MNPNKEITRSKILDSLDILHSLDNIPENCDVSKIVIRDPKDKTRYICLICRDEKSKTFSGLLKNM